MAKLSVNTLDFEAFKPKILKEKKVCQHLLYLQNFYVLWNKPISSDTM